MTILYGEIQCEKGYFNVIVVFSVSFRLKLVKYAKLTDYMNTCQDPRKMFEL